MKSVIKRGDPLRFRAQVKLACSPKWSSGVTGLGLAYLDTPRPRPKLADSGLQPINPFGLSTLQQLVMESAARVVRDRREIERSQEAHEESPNDKYWYLSIGRSG